MKRKVYNALKALAEPKTVLVWRDYKRDFGISFWTLEGPEWSDGATSQTAHDLQVSGYVRMTANEHDKRTYTITDAGKQALAAAEAQSNESQTSKA